MESNKTARYYLKSFKAISVEKLSNLKVDTVMGEIQNKLN